MRSQVSKSKTIGNTRSRKKETTSQKHCDARRRLEDRLEEIKLQRELREFDFQY